MRILITGAHGLVGSHLVHACTAESVLAPGHRDLDITDDQAVEQTVRRFRPDVIFNCAVIGVDDCESDPALAARINVHGPASLAAAGERVNATFVHFSSNYVFDGDHPIGEPYTIDDQALPINVYGATKLAGEHAVAAASSRAFNIRTSWIFGDGKNNFLSTVAARLARGERVEAIADTFASATYVNDLVARVLLLLERRHYGTWQIVNEGVCSYETFAREAARLAGVDDATAARLIVTTTEASLGRLAPRPRSTPMRCLLSERLGLPPMRPWQQALAAYLG
jgi:dTDP-4-dehydrorhamnose reductase